ncbi:hypothetical protein HPP92_005614 [Vanilla planifolia]|uniref:Uncharacterized protein n=1 Tax=Vanilla planifolia TaxID=51239 RepID=A0A835RHG7_VANPL|nr:hypothetical protein HPP92_005614 [Vanilla planifolia]
MGFWGFNAPSLMTGLTEITRRVASKLKKTVTGVVFRKDRPFSTKRLSSTTSLRTQETQTASFDFCGCKQEEQPRNTSND